MDLVILVSSIHQRLDSNVLKNLLSRFEVMDYQIPKCTHMHSNKSLVVAYVLILFLRVVRMDILENLSMTMTTQSFPCLVEGRPNM